MTYSAAQAAFVSALQSAAAAGEISDLCDKKDLVKVANSIGKTCIPVWVRRNESLCDWSRSVEHQAASRW